MGAWEQFCSRLQGFPLRLYGGIEPLG